MISIAPCGLCGQDMLCMQNVVENKEMGMVWNLIFKFHWKNLLHCISLKVSYTTKMSHWKGVVKGNLKVKDNSTREWKDYLQPMEIKPKKKTTSSDKFLILWWGDELK